MMKIVILIRPSFLQYTLPFYLDPVSSFKHILYNIKQKCIFKSLGVLPLGVLCANFVHFLSPVKLFLRGTYLEAERFKNISQKNVQPGS